MALRSRLFGGDPRFELCAHKDAAHIVPGSRGDAVGKIQTALFSIDALPIARAELEQALYGPSTAAAVLSFKRKRGIINRSYQTKADDIVGRMTIAALDAEMAVFERRPVIADRSSVGWTTRRV